MIIKISYPYKDKIHSIDLKEIYIQTDSDELIKELKSTINPIEIGIILSENYDKFKKIEKTKPDLVIDIEEVIINPELKYKEL
ncbi:hypothetical protein [Caminibacter pacificus]|uniref:Uncharacterized protein n=1 Tax=Caminibacter pacificus TaxID=1424653 RepID=A0AAJ4UYQ2_9BACT|nr:hypothetical protein [Caminibacter pacificus]QCI28094.1 hypothetical protein C6V80_03730 [Caminibacter pacificus]ROR41196.1 hypothetical protein EDC58_0681 [Caminibacter pacificus]